MKCRCDHQSCDCDLSNRKLSLKNVFGPSTGLEPVASALALQCSTNLFHSFHGYDELNELAFSQRMSLHSSVGGALQRQRRGHGFESR